jgi:DNA mismatch endonuclease (patch repair protein)
MARIGGRDTSPEVAIRSALWRKGFRYKLNVRAGSSRPDLVFARQSVAVFVDGCFWHGCPEHYVRPRTNERFWSDKLSKNVERDRRQTLELEAEQWRVLRFWEHQAWTDLEWIVETVSAALKQNDWKPKEDWRVKAVVPVVGADAREERHLCQLRDKSICKVEVGARVAGRGRPRKSSKIDGLA